MHLSSRPALPRPSGRSLIAFLPTLRLRSSASLRFPDRLVVPLWEPSEDAFHEPGNPARPPGAGRRLARPGDGQPVRDRQGADAVTALPGPLPGLGPPGLVRAGPGGFLYVLLDR